VDVLAELQRLWVRDEKHGLRAADDALDGREQSFGVESCKALVEHDHFGPLKERARDE
jgi:hypothetical protein